MIAKVVGIIAVSISTFLIFGSLGEFAAIICDDALSPIFDSINDGKPEGESRVTFFDKIANLVVSR